MNTKEPYYSVREKIEAHGNISPEEKIQLLLYYFSKESFKRDFRKIKDFKAMHPGRAPILLILLHCEGLTMAEMSKELNIKQSSVTVIVKRLEKDGLILKETDEKDLRKQKISLTASGKEMAERHIEHHKEKTALLFSPLTEEEKNIFAEILIKIIENLTRGD